MKKRLLLVLLVLLFALGMSPASYGKQADRSVTVKLPNFNITVNGVRIDNTRSQYPFIVYNDVTYFPMTYSGCRFLGLENYWNGNAAGLTVDATGITAAYLPYQTSSKNGTSYKASIPTFQIKVNGKAIDNSKEQYPLISFRNITYFPLTWEFAVKEFGWDYSFSGKDGLMISSDNIKLEQKKITSSILKQAFMNSDPVAVTGQYVYYADSRGRIIQAPLGDMTKTKSIYELPVWSYGNGEFVSPGLTVERGIAYLKYHQGGAVMGSDFVIRLNNDT